MTRLASLLFPGAGTRGGLVAVTVRVIVRVIVSVTVIVSSHTRSLSSVHPPLFRHGGGEGVTVGGTPPGVIEILLLFSGGGAWTWGTEGATCPSGRTQVDG